MEQLAEQSVYHYHLLHQTSGGQVLEGQSDNTNKVNTLSVVTCAKHDTAFRAIKHYVPTFL